MDTKNTEIRIRLSDLIFAVQKKWFLVLLATIVGILVGFGINGMSYIQGTNLDYKITCSFAISAQGKTGTFSGNSSYMTSADFYLAQDLVDASSYVMKSKKVITTAMDDAGIRDKNWEKVRDNLLLTRYNDTQIVEMELDWSDATKGKDLANAILKEAKKELPSALQIGSVTVIDEPQAERQSGGFSFAALWLLIEALGFCAGIGMVLLDLILRPTLINTDDTESLFGVFKIGEVQKDKEFFDNQTPENITSISKNLPVVQQISSATYIMLNLVNKKQKHHCLYFTSAVTGEGKTALLSNMGVHLADMGKKVLLLDMNVQNPSLGSLFIPDVSYYQSINALYRNDAELEDITKHINGFLDVIPMAMERETFRFDDEAIGIVQKLVKQYDYVLIDTPAVGMYPDVLKLNAVVEAAVMVIEYNYAVIQDIQNAVDMLGKSGIHILGALINQVKAKNVFGSVYNNRQTKAQQPKASDSIAKKQRAGKTSGTLLERLDTDMDENGTGGTLTDDEAIRLLYEGPDEEKEEDTEEKADAKSEDKKEK